MARAKRLCPDPATLRARIDERGMLTVRVSPNAASEAVEIGSDQVAAVAVRTTATPEHGKANDAVLRLLAAALDVPVSTLQIVRGATSRTKVVRVPPEP